MLPTSYVDIVNESIQLYTDEPNYLLELLWVNAELGRLSSSLLVNFHRFNYVPNADVAARIDKIIGRLEQVKIKYQELPGTKDAVFNMGR